MLNQNPFGSSKEAATLLEIIDSATDKKLCSKVCRILGTGFTTLDQINKIEDERTRLFCRNRWLDFYKELLNDHLRRSVWPKPVCTFSLNLIKMRLRQTSKPSKSR